MISSEVERTLVKSPPELWTELSDPAALARHLGEFGEIRITRIEPEQRVEWEAENATGSVMIKPSGWGTKVTLSVTKEASEPDAQQSPEPEPAPDAPPEPEAQQPPEPEPAPEPEAQQPPEPEPVAVVEPEPGPDPVPAPEPHLGFFARLFGRRRRERAPAPAALRPMAGKEGSPGQPGDAFAAVSQVLAPETFAGGRTTFMPWPEPAPQALPAADVPAEAPADAPAETPAPTGADSTPHADPTPNADPAPSDAATATADISAEIRAAEEVAAAEVTAVLTSVLDRLGAAHHRPFSRS
jgi:hypothetical protein